MQNIIPGKVNYGAFTDLSKSLNELFGDQSGRSVSTRTANGFKSFFNAPDMEEENAELIVHSGIIAAGILLKSNDEGKKATGILLSFTLLLCYQAGKIRSNAHQSIYPTK